MSGPTVDLDYCTRLLLELAATPGVNIESVIDAAWCVLHYHQPHNPDTPAIQLARRLTGTTSSGP